MGENPFMRQAIDLAAENVRSGRGGPFGALIVRDGALVASGTNLVTASKDPTAHAEIVAIRNACAALGAFHLTGCEIFASCEPCPMCLGAIYWARLSRVTFGCTHKDAAEAGFDDSFIYSQFRVSGAERRIPMSGLMREEALECFREWERKTDRIAY